MRLLIRILSLLFLFFLLRYIFRSIFTPPRSNSQAGNGDEAAKFQPGRMRQGRMEKDPICGTYVDVATSLSLTKGEDTRYFCSEECKKKFQVAGKT